MNRPSTRGGAGHPPERPIMAEFDALSNETNETLLLIGAAIATCAQPFHETMEQHFLKFCS